MTDRVGGRFFRPELDILRFCAFLSVYAVHALPFSRQTLEAHRIPAAVAAAVTALIRAGSYGVDLFFVLSAYLITELLEREQARTGSIDIPAFYTRRILRIWPLYYVFLTLAVTVPFLNPGHEFHGIQVLLFALFLGNWGFYFLGWVGYAAIPLWSLSVEEQFYLFWPPIVARLSRRGLVAVAIGMLIVANLARYRALWRHEETRHIWTSTFAHLDSIGAGILIALWLNGRVPRLSIAARVALLMAALAAFALRGYSVGIEPGDLMYPWETVLQYPLVVAACAATLLAFLGLPIRLPPIEYLGKISYGLYVFHISALMITDRLLHGLGVSNLGLRVALSLGLTIGVSAASYALLEAPFLRLKRRFAVIESRP